jgi:anti-anti-sigma regulatory factor
MALFSKPPAKKPEAPKPKAKPAAAGAGVRTPVSARDVAVQAQGRRGPERPRAEPAADISMTGASLIEWSPVRSASIEVAQANPGLCAVLENAALLYGSGQAQPARDLLEKGVQEDPDAKASPLAWLALFDLLQRANDRAAFDQHALQYVMQFERSPPPWEQRTMAPVAAPKATPGGYVLLTGKLSSATAPQLEALRRALDKHPTNARLDFASMAGFDEAGAKLLAEALAYARRQRCALTLQRTEKMRAALDILLRRGREAGEGPWLLALELLQFDQKQEPFDERAIEYAIAFEQSPPSWEPPPVPKGDAAPVEPAASANDEGAASPNHELVVWSGVLTGSATHSIAQITEHAYHHAVVPIDMTGVERIDFVCAGSLLNAITRVEAQRKAVQIVGASPIIRALLLLIGISPRHFLKKPQ